VLHRSCAGVTHPTYGTVACRGVDGQSEVGHPPYIRARSFRRAGMWGDMSFFDYPTGGERVGSEEEEQQYFLADRPEDDWALLLDHTRRRRFRAGEAVIEPDDAERAFYLVIEGTLEAVRQEGRRSRPRSLRTFASGTLIGELSFFDGRPLGVLVRAVTDGEVVRLGVEELDALARLRPDLVRAILFDLGRIVAVRLRHAQSSARVSLV
jgi:CRP/FNR family transcriptional regulator, cyclic AMP receptor protein